MRIIILPLLASILIILAPAAAQEQKSKPQKFDAPKSFEPTAEVMHQIESKTAQLAAKIAELRKDKKNWEQLPDVEIFLRGAQNIVRFNEFFDKNSGAWTLECLDRGLERAEQIVQGKLSWKGLAGKNVVRGRRSRIDSTAQPYGVTFPVDYGTKGEKPRRVDIVLHGRNANLTEVAFLHSHSGNRKVPPDQDFIQIDIFGRGNNAYRWAGETDVMEAWSDFFAKDGGKGNNDFPDMQRCVLRGFSMGGAGTWHLGLHHPSLWCVIGPGAGFTTTHGYAGGLPDQLPAYQERCLRIYDALDYAENAANVPIVAYSGGNDPQKLAADNIEKRLKELNINSMTHLVAPGLGHIFPAEWFNKANALWSAYAAKGRAVFPEKVSFVTYTTKYAICDWICITGLEKHYEKAVVTAERKGTRYKISTKNVQGLRLQFQIMLPGGSIRKLPTGSVVIDGQELEVDHFSQRMGGFFPPTGFDQAFMGPFHLVRQSGKWEVRKVENNHPGRKTMALQGPIDDAFCSAFVCVLGSGETYHPATQKHLDAKLAAFRHDWAKHWRGELPTTGDYAVTPNDIMDKNLILFGDPSSNLTLAQIMPKLPLTWTKDEIVFAGKKFSSAEHVPVMIFPNPLNPKRYVVLNTGHTFPSADYTKTNALLFPRLGDYAVLRFAPTKADAAAHEVATAGLFDELWRVPQ